VAAEAPILPCRACGAPLAVDPEAVEALCGACRAVTPVPAQVRERARAYRASLSVERSRVEDARRSNFDAFAKLGKYFGPPLALVVGGHVVATMTLDESYRSYELGAFAGAMGLLGIAFFVWLVGAVRADLRGGDVPQGQAARAPMPVFQGSTVGTCSTCGGQVTFVIEQPNARCPYCGATVFATPAVQHALLAVAAERADLEIGRASRAALRDLAASFDSGVFDRAMTWIRWAGLAAVPVLLMVVGAALVLHDGIPDPDALDALAIVGLVLLGGGAVVLAGIVGIVWLVRSLSRVHAIRRTLVSVAATGGLAPQRPASVSFEGGTRSSLALGVRPVFDWLDAHWAAPVPPEVLSVARSDDGDPVRRISVPLAFAGRPALLVVAHAPHVRRMDLFFALHKRRGPEVGHVTRAAQEIRGAGYAVLVTNGGTHVMQLDSDPRAFAPHVVTWLLERAGQVAQA
jgi:DNA-directed RNA polymerase subunit RPC12/RpoP